MPFEQHEEGTTVTGRNSITLFQTLVQIRAVKAEMTGMRVTRRPLVWRRLKKAYGIKGGSRQVLAWLEAKKVELEKEVVEGREGTWNQDR